MANGNPIIYLPLGLSLILAVLCILLCVASLSVLIRTKKQQRDQGDAPDWSIPTLDAHAHLSSFFHTWAPGIKVASLLCYSFMIVSLQHLAWCSLALLISLVAIHQAKIPWQRPLRRLAAMTGFLLMLLLVLPLTSPVQPGETILLFPFLESFPFRLPGFFLAIAIALKACAVALLMEPMLGTAPLSATLQGFTTLGLPPAFIQMTLLSHRYIFVFQQELQRMLRSLRVRGFTATTDLATLRIMGNCLGMLFVRSFERTERVYEAMQSRGYRGTLPAGTRCTLTSRDLVKGGLWIMIGLLLLVLDRLFPVL